MTDTNDLTTLINETLDVILDRWNAEAAELGIDSVDHYESQIEALEDELGRFTAKAISGRYLQRAVVEGVMTTPRCPVCE